MTAQELSPPEPMGADEYQDAATAARKESR